MKLRELLRVAWVTGKAIHNKSKYGSTCSMCGKPIPESSLLVDYCIDCAKKRESLGEEKI